MIRRFLLLTVLSLPLMARAYNVPTTDTIRWEKLPRWEELLQPLEPVYLKNAVEVSPCGGLALAWQLVRKCVRRSVGIRRFAAWLR